MRSFNVVRASVASTLIAVPVARAAPAPPFQAMLERPLFSPTRRPPPPVAADVPQAPAAPAPAPTLDVTLSGVIASAGAGVALLKRPGDAAPLRVALGGLVDGWTLAEVRPRAVVLRRDGRSVTVDMSSPR